jgi:hypothetical protein
MADIPQQGSPTAATQDSDAGVTQLPPFGVEADPISIFPRELRDEGGYPFVAFAIPDKQKTIFLPIPPSLSFSDGASYSSMNLGIIGSIGAETIGAMQNAAAAGDSSFTKIVNASMHQLGRSVGSRAGENKEQAAYAVASIFARDVVKAEGIANIIDFSNRKVIAPNTNTTFTNVNIRSFSFQFKMVAKDKKDSEEIRKIVNTFRKYLYPEGTSLILNYPPTWTIKFYNGSEGADGSSGSEEMKYIPKIGRCYLTAFTSSYNGSTNIFHEDGSPTEVDVTLNFQETKAHHRGELEEIENGTVR